MNNQHQSFALRVSVAAVRSALIVLALTQVARAQYAEPTVKDLTTPASTIEAGSEWVSRDSFKFGEYNGLENKGFYGIGNLDLRGGGAYDSNDTSRWRFTGLNLGTDARSVKGEYGWQGTFRLNMGYDELLRNQDDRYQTPYLGAGGSSLVLPPSWTTPMYRTAVNIAGNPSTTQAPLVATNLGLAATGYGSPLVTNTAYVCSGAIKTGCAVNPALGGTLGTLQTIGFQHNAANNTVLNNNATDLSDFHTVDLSTKREKFDVGGTYDLNPASQVVFSFRQERKDGLQQLGVVNALSAGPAASGNNAATLAGENAVIIPKLIDTVTDQYNASYNYVDKKSFFTLAYYGSLFTNNVKAMTVQNAWGQPATIGTTTYQAPYGPSSATISEEPDNQLHQFRMTGGYNLLPSTKAVVDLSYSRNTQNDHYVLDPAMFSTPTLASGAPLAGAAVGNGAYSPVNTANGLVVDKAVDFKLTSRPLNPVSVSAGYKYDNRDNETPVNTYLWYDAGDQKNIGAPNNTVFGGTNATIPGVPYNQPLYSSVNAVANRPYSKTLNQGDLDAEFHIAPGHAIKAGYEYQSIDRYCNNTWIDCSYADQTKENTVKLEYRFTAAETVSGRLAFDQSSRTVDYNPNAWMSLVPGLQATGLPPLAAQGWNGSVLGFLNTYGLTPNGLPLPSAVNPTLTAVGPSSLTNAQALAIYQLLYGAGNGSLSNAYYANHNVTNNWAGLDVYNMANRDRSRVRGSVNWQTTEKLALQGGFDYRHDDYPDNTYGLENGTAWSLNFDAGFTPNEDLSLDAFYTHEDSKTQSGGNSASNGTVARNTGITGVGPAGNTTANNQVVGGCVSNGRDSVAGLAANATQYQIYNNNLKIDPCAAWGADIHDRTDTVGLSFTEKRVGSHRFSVSGDASYSRSVTSNDMTGGFYYANPLATLTTGVPAIYYINAIALPDVTTQISHVGLSGRYLISKTSAVRLSYSISWLHTDDYLYNTTQPATTSAQVMPTMDTAQNYVVHVVGVTYSYTFH